MTKQEFRTAYQRERISQRIDRLLFAITGASVSMISRPFDAAADCHSARRIGDYLQFPASTDGVTRKFRSRAFRPVRLPA